MDPITHYCSGILAKNYLTDKRDLKTTIIFGLVSMSPDIDNFVGIFGTPFTYLLHHRGFTHSFVGGFLLTVMLVVIAKLIKYHDKRLLLNFYILILIHIFLDVMTNYGTQIFLPFSRERVALNAMFIIDPIYLILLIIFYFMTKKRSSLVLIGFLFIFLYPIINLSVKNIYESYLNIKGDKKITILTAPLSPFLWRIVEDKGEYYNMKLSFIGKDIKTYKKPSQEILGILEKDENLKIYKWFSTYIYQETLSLNGVKYVTLGDLRFNFPGRNSPFILKLEIKDEVVIYSLGKYSSSIVR